MEGLKGIRLVVLGGLPLRREVGMGGSGLVLGVSWWICE